MHHIYSLKSTILVRHYFKMEHLIFWLFMHLGILCETRQANVRQLNMKMNRITRITDGLQKDVSDIWTVISSSGIETLEFGNKTRTDIDDLKQNEDCAKEQEHVNGTVNGVKELRTEVEELILYSRKGFKNEKEFQREAISDLKRSNGDFQTGILEENSEIKQNVENLNIKVSDLQETSKNSQLSIASLNLDLNENVNETDDHKILLESMRKMLENLSVKQSSLELKNQKLERTISDMQGELTTLKASMPCEKNWTKFNSHCYQYVRLAKSWNTALATCKAKDSYLVEITSESELKFVAGLVHDEHVIVWIGATDTQPGYEGTFVYQDSKHAVPQKFWADGEPENDRDHCVVMIGSEEFSKFYDTRCAGWSAQKYYFICENPGMLRQENQ